MNEPDEELEATETEADEVDACEPSPAPEQTTEQTTEQDAEQMTRTAPPIPEGPGRVLRVQMASDSVSPWSAMAAAVICLAVLALIAYVLWRGAQREDDLLGAVFELGKGA